MFIKRFVECLNCLSPYVKQSSIKIGSNLCRIEQKLGGNNAPLKALCCIQIAINAFDLDKQMNSTKISQDLVSVNNSIYSQAIFKKTLKSLVIYSNILINDELTDEWVETSNSIRRSMKPSALPINLHVHEVK